MAIRANLFVSLLFALGLAGCEEENHDTKQAVRVALRDPSSATFRTIYVGPGGVTCGDVNAKNGFGGYTGFRPFYIDRGAVFFPDERSPDAGEKFIWKTYREKCLGEKEKGIFGLF
jgi:hypothetical protein